MPIEKEIPALTRLQFGDAFFSKSEKEGGQKYLLVVINVGSPEEDRFYKYGSLPSDGVVFHVANIQKDSQGNEVLGAVGTADTSHLTRIVETWSFARLEKAIIRQGEAYSASREEIEKMTNYYRELSKKPPRVFS